MTGAKDRQDAGRARLRGLAYASAVAGRLLSAPLILAIAVAAFWLAEYVYDAASSLGGNADQALGLLTLFAGVTFFFNLGLTHLKELCEALGRECMAYLRSLFERGSGSFRKSATALMKRMVPILLLAFGLGILSGYITIPDGEPGLPGTILLDDGVGEMTVDFREADGAGVSANVAGIRNSIRKVFIEALDERSGPIAPDRFAGALDTASWRKSNHVASFFVTFERASLVPNADSAADPGWECTDVAFANGVEYDPRLNGNLIQRLAGALAPCGEEDGTRPVWIGVRGYASSAQFRNPRGEIRENSPQLNVCVANRRRRSVEDALQIAIRNANARQQIRIVPAVDYTQPSQLTRDLQIVDRPGGQIPEAGSLPQDSLTRAAHINLLSAAKCGVD